MASGGFKGVQDTSRISIGCHPLELVGMFYLSGGNVLAGMVGSVNYSRDCDGIAGFAGGLAAASNGSEQVPQDMIKKVNIANGFELMEMAKQMQGPIIKVMKEKETAVQDIKALNRCLKSYS